MTTDIHAAFEAKYKASAQDPACADELRVFSDGWQARDAEIAALREVLINARQALQEANEAGSGGPIQDTIWMPASISSAETLFDYLDASMAQTTVQTQYRNSDIAPPDTALKDRTVRAMLTHYEKWGDTEGFGQMVAAVAALFRGDGGKEKPVDWDEAMLHKGVFWLRDGDTRKE